MKKNPIKTRKYFIERLIDGEWLHSDIPTSTLKDAEEIAKHMLGRNNVTQTRVISFKGDDSKQVHRNYSHEDFIKNPVKHKNYFVTRHGRDKKPVLFFNGLTITADKPEAAIFHSEAQARRVAEYFANKYNMRVHVDFE